MTTRKDVFLNFLKDRPGEQFTVANLSAALSVPPQHFVTDIRKWMDLPEFAHIIRSGGGGKQDPYVYHYDKKRVHDPLPPIVKRAPRTPSTDLVPMKNLKRLTETFAQVLGFDSKGNIILLDDKDRIIRGKVMQ